MTRLLFWIALIILVVMAVRSKVRAAMAARGHGPVPGPGPGGMGAGHAAGNAYRRVEDASEPMSRCASCGVYFPASETVRAGGHDYCSPAHAHQSVIRKPEA